MAVIIPAYPQDYSQSGNPLIFIFSSDQTAQVNFSFKVKIYIDLVLQETHQVFPEATTYAHFDASDIAERYCNKPNTSNSLLVSANNFVEVKAEVIEMYGSPIIEQASNDVTVNVYKARLSKRAFLNYDNTDYVFGAKKLWLTTFPRELTRYIRLDTLNKFMYLTDENGIDIKVVIKNAANATINTYTSGTHTTTKISIVNIDYTSLNTECGFTPNEITLTKYIDISFVNGSVSEVYRLTIDERCTSTSYKHLVFLSQIGSLEPYTFIKRSTETASIKGQGFEQQFGYFDGTNYSFELGGVTDYVKEIDNKLEIQSDWLDETEYQWLCENLLTSPLVYLFDDGNLIQVRVTTSSYEIKTNENDQVFMFKATILTGHDNSTVV